MSLYEIPSEYFYRLHQPRPRFKNNIENVLGYVAFSISEIGSADTALFNELLDKSLRNFEDNETKTAKTIANWRTEISALFGLFYEEDGVTYSTKIAKELVATQDLERFFRRFVATFQYPGGHLKPQEIMGMVENGIRYHPCRWLSRFLLFTISNSRTDSYITDAEFCHCAMNDLRVSRGAEDIGTTFGRMKQNRITGKEYDTRGDTIRYAKDVLDYMVLARLLIKTPENKYIICRGSEDLLQVLADSANYFNQYDDCKTLDKITALRPSWIRYVNEESDRFIHFPSVIASTGPFIADEIEEDVEINKETNVSKANTIGDIGERLILVHEKRRITDEGRGDLKHLIKRIPSHLAIGYDINSIEKNEIRRHVEVKTSFSNSPLTLNRFHLTPSEWSSAKTHGNRYFVYRLQLIGTDQTKLFLLQDPIGLYKKNLVEMTAREGADFVFNDAAGTYVDLLKWKS